MRYYLPICVASTQAELRAAELKAAQEAAQQRLAAADGPIGSGLSNKPKMTEEELEAFKLAVTRKAEATAAATKAAKAAKAKAALSKAEIATLARKYVVLGCCMCRLDGVHFFYPSHPLSAFWFDVLVSPNCVHILERASPSLQQLRPPQAEADHEGSPRAASNRRPKRRAKTKCTNKPRGT